MKPEASVRFCCIGWEAEVDCVTCKNSIFGAAQCHIEAVLGLDIQPIVARGFGGKREIDDLEENVHLRRGGEEKTGTVGVCRVQAGKTGAWDVTRARLVQDATTYVVKKWHWIRNGHTQRFRFPVVRIALMYSDCNRQGKCHVRSSGRLVSHLRLLFFIVHP